MLERGLAACSDALRTRRRRFDARTRRREVSINGSISQALNHLDSHSSTSSSGGDRRSSFRRHGPHRKPEGTLGWTPRRSPGLLSHSARRRAHCAPRCRPRWSAAWIRPNSSSTRSPTCSWWTTDPSSQVADFDAAATQTICNHVVAALEQHVEI